MKKKILYSLFILVMMSLLPSSKAYAGFKDSEGTEWDWQGYHLGTMNAAPVDFKIFYNLDRSCNPTGIGVEHSNGTVIRDLKSIHIPGFEEFMSRKTRKPGCCGLRSFLTVNIFSCQTAKQKTD